MFWILIHNYLKHEYNKNYLNSVTEKTKRKNKVLIFFFFFLARKLYHLVRYNDKKK